MSDQEKAKAANERKVAGIVDREVLDRIRKQRGDEDERAQAPLSFRLIRRLFGFAAPYRRKMIGLFITVGARALQLPVLAWGAGAIINGPVERGDLKQLTWSVVAFVAFAVITELTFRYRIKWALEIGESVIHDLRAAMFRHWLGLTMGYFNRQPVGRLISRLTGDAENVRVGVQNVLFVSLVQAGQMLGCAVLMAIEDWRLFLVVLGIAPVVWVMNHYFRGRLSAAYRRQSDSFSRITATMAESVGGIRVTQSFSRERVNADHFRALVEDHAHYNFVAARTSGTFLPLLELNGQLFMALLVVIGGGHVLDPDQPMSLGSMIQFFFLAGLFFSPITVLGNMFNEALTAMAGAERVFSVLDTQPDWTDPPDAKEPASLEGRVELREVGFSYEPDRPVLKGVSFTAEPGECVAIVGATGGGKSTVAGLIAKFYVPESGAVLIDGNDTRDLSSRWLHAHLGIVPQQNHLFGGTILENIRIVKPGADREEVRAALEQLDCLETIENIPKGLDAEVGERGSGLSLGQRQLVCFARALIADPRILILDEATSAIDPLTEARTQRAMRALMAGRTSFVLAHRLSTLRHANRVVVMAHGEVAEQGTPEELIASGGAFAELWQHATGERS
ncbi:MAG: ABC transporter ATP-binding protein [Verrucomicrobiae bacterium]|nr:ABC transporter ATP-binding protein [Verrucomicrobiae bacterium]